MEQCYEYLGCDKKDCIMYGQEGTDHCWEVEETLCNNPAIQIMLDKLAGKKEDACHRSGCIWYKAARDRGIL